MNPAALYYAMMGAQALTMVSHRYYRLNVSATGGASYCGVPELYLMATIGGSSVATGGTASANSSYSGMPASNAFDGSTSTAWYSNVTTGPFILEYDFGSGIAHKIVQYAIHSPSGLGSAPYSWTLQYSDDNSTWTTCDTRTAVAMTVGAYNTFTVASP